VCNTCTVGVMWWNNCAGFDIRISQEDGSSHWTVLVVTPVMARVQTIGASAEQIFCDSTSSCDAGQSTVTLLLTASKAGALPIAVLIHDGQSTDSYTCAFQLLKNAYPLCFGGNDVSYLCSYSLHITL